MVPRIVFLIWSIVLLSSEATSQRVNVAALSKGSAMYKTPPSYKEVTERNLFLKYSPGALFDESESMWCSKNSRFPMIFTQEFVEEYTLTELVFDNKCEKYTGIETKDVRVEVSTTDPEHGYIPIGNYQLAQGKTNRFRIEPTKARWIRLVILSNYGHESWVELAEFEAWGTPSNLSMQTISINGAWKTNWQNISFQQQGKSFDGEYSYGSVKGIVRHGTIYRNVISFQWEEGSLVGTAKLYLNKEGDRLSGLWQNSNNIEDFGLWTMTRSQAQEIVYEDTLKANNPTISTPSETPDVVEFEGQEVRVGEKVVLDNVLFVRARAVLLPESLPQLSQLAELLKKNPGLKLELTGHTDNQGSEALNTKLSEDRVQAVIRHLVNKGIEEARLSGKGLGSHEPLNDNSTEAKRKLNRRVEFELIK